MQGEEIEECYHGPTIGATAEGKAGQCTKPTNLTLENFTKEFPPKVYLSTPIYSLHACHSLEQILPRSFFLL